MLTNNTMWVIVGQPWSDRMKKPAKPVKRQRRGDLRLTLPEKIQQALRQQARRDRRDIWVQARLYIEEGIAAHD